MPRTKYLCIAGPIAIAPDTILGTYTAAKLCNLAHQTIARCIDQGLLKRLPGPERRVRAGDLLAFMERHGMPVPEKLRF